MEAKRSRVDWTGTSRLIPSRFPTIGLFDTVASADDLEAIIELEGWTNDRLNNELGRIHAVPTNEWLTSVPFASVVMAAYCHAHPQGARFSQPDRGAWYCAKSFETAAAEVSYHRWRELQEVGIDEARVELRLYNADFDLEVVDIRPNSLVDSPLYASDNYRESQAFAQQVLSDGDHGVVYRSVRDEHGECLACFKPREVKNVRIGGHLEMRWSTQQTPTITWLQGKAH